MTTIKQELPPPGGFKNVHYERIPLKKYWPATMKWLGVLGSFAYGVLCYKEAKEEMRWDGIEREAGFLSVLPLLTAEYDRMRLKMFIKFREEEAELMKDVEGWKVGTYKGSPIYKSVKPDEWYEPRGLEPWIYASPNEFESMKAVVLNN